MRLLRALRLAVLAAVVAIAFAAIVRPSSTNAPRSVMTMATTRVSGSWPGDISAAKVVIARLSSDIDVALHRPYDDDHAPGALAMVLFVACACAGVRHSVRGGRLVGAGGNMSWHEQVRGPPDRVRLNKAH